MEQQDVQKAIASIDGAPLSFRRLVDLLLLSRGSAVFDQLVVFERAMRLVQAKGLAVTDEDIEEEYERALKKLAASTTALVDFEADSGFNRNEAERLLKTVLQERGVSHEEFYLGVQCNACLRRLAKVEVDVSQAELNEEFERRFGPRVEVRHIQLPSLRETARVQRALAQGEDFADVARGFSANTSSAPSGGLLQPFSTLDPEVPKLFRSTAFSLSVGDVSEPIRVGQWFHLIKLERIIDPPAQSLVEVQDELDHYVRGHKVEEDMKVIYTSLLEEADVKIFDPVLKRAVRDRKPETGN